MAIAPACLIRTVADHSSRRPQDLLLAMASALRAGLMDELVSEVRAGIPAVHLLAPLSYRHELGFTKLTIGEFADLRLKVRLHVWYKAAMPDEANIHNHRFDGYSYVVHGQLEDTRWEAHASPTGLHRHYRYQPRLDSPEYTLRYVGRERLDPLHVVRVCQGDTYIFSSEDLHTTAVTSDSLLTLFVEDRRCLRAHADVFALHYPAGHHRIAAPALSDEDYLNILADTARSFCK